MVFARPGREPYFDWFAAMEEADGPKGETELRRCRSVWTYATESVNGQKLVGDQIDSGEFVEVDAACPIHGAGRDGGCGPLFMRGESDPCSCKSVPRDTIQATPSAIVARCIAASTSEKGNCPDCGIPFDRMVKKIDRTPAAKTRTMVEMSRGFAPGCKCHIEGTPGEPTRPIVLDPFSGSGTTLLTATMLGRDFVGSELDPRFVAKIAPARLAGNARRAKPPLPLP
jgi:hypothetical protein